LVMASQDSQEFILSPRRTAILNGLAGVRTCYGLFCPVGIVRDIALPVRVDDH
jgi:hypothetical protein